MIPYKCKECGNPGLWNDKPLSLHLDHIDGNRKNNTIYNLRFLCPSCHSQTKTFGSKNNKIRTNEEIYNILDSELKDIELTKEKLENLTKDNTLEQISMKLKMSKEKVKKYIKHFNIEYKRKNKN